MRYVCVLLLACFAIPVAAQQDTPRVEVFGGFSYLHVDTQGLTGPSLDAICNNLIGSCPAGTFQVHPNFNGWNAAVQFNATRFLGIKADLSGNYGTPIALSSQAQSFLSQLGIAAGLPKVRSYNYLFGPVLFQSRGRFKPFAHALFGANSVSTNLSNIAAAFGIPGLTLSDTALAMAFGGGIDVKLTDHISLRAGQVDYLFTKHNFSGGIQGIATHQNNYRASAGVVFQFGGGSTRSTTSAPSKAPPPYKEPARKKEPEERPAHKVTSSALMPISALGVTVQTTPRNAGAQITEVAPNSVAALAGIHPEDIINSVNGAQVTTPMELAAALSVIASGTTVRLGYMIRGAWQTETTVILGNH
jgi:opacity protein-like surface antigen